MRIAYVVLHLDQNTLNGGVGGKIESQIRIWSETGHNVQLFLLTPDTIESNKIRSFTFEKSNHFPLFKSVSREFSRSRSLSALINAVAEVKPDIIYLRYGLYAHPLVRLFHIAPVVVEINSNDVEEYKYRGIFFYLLNLCTRSFTLRNASGIIFPSHELKQLPENRALNRPVCVISNGVDIQNGELYPAPNNKIPVLIFAGSPGYNWHGVDKIFELAVLCPDLRIEIVGYGIDDLKSKIPPNIILHGFIPKEKMGDILAKADIAIGTLALHRKKMQEASALKVREALMAGIPTIIAYTDTDLVNLDLPYILRLPNTEDNVRMNAERIRDFCYQMRGVRIDREKIVPQFDQRLKERERLVFLEHIFLAQGDKINANLPHEK